MSKVQQRQQQRKVDDWNLKYPVGQKVCVTKDDGTKIETVTIDKATLLGGHTAVAWLKNISGCYLLDRVKAIEMKFRKKLCDQCNLDGECDCQSSQERVAKCGMEEVLAFNKSLRNEHRDIEGEKDYFGCYIE